MESNRDTDKVGIYIHIPFCEKKCFYCDFYSIENRAQQRDFINSLAKEIQLSSANAGMKFTADTIFLGGGTPSLLSPQELEFILNFLHKNFHISDEIEFTMECNPGTVSRESLTAYRRLGVNRLSFGIQSFFNEELKFLSRIHDSQEAVEAFELARSAGFDNVNMDLMYGLPDQPDDRVLANLEKAVALNPEHISAYNLIVEHGTPLYSAVEAGKIKNLDELTEARMYELIMALLEENGYEHYEISNYAHHGFECKHNLKYWNSEQYIGFGPSAHSYLGRTRWWNISSLSNYMGNLAMDQLPISANETLSEVQLVDEFVMLQLRQGKLDLNALRQKFLADLDSTFISDLEESGYASVSKNQILLTKNGFTVCDEIAKQSLANLYNIEKVEVA